MGGVEINAKMLENESRAGVLQTCSGGYTDDRIRPLTVCRKRPLGSFRKLSGGGGGRGPPPPPPPPPPRCAGLELVLVVALVLRVLVILVLRVLVVLVLTVLASIVLSILVAVAGIVLIVLIVLILHGAHLAFAERSLPRDRKSYARKWVKGIPNRWDSCYNQFIKWYQEVRRP